MHEKNSLILKSGIVRQWPNRYLIKKKLKLHGIINCQRSNYKRNDKADTQKKYKYTNILRKYNDGEVRE